MGEREVARMVREVYLDSAENAASVALGWLLTAEEGEIGHSLYFAVKDVAEGLQALVSAIREGER